MNESDEKLRQLIAENIAYYRKLNGDTQAGLAEKLSYSDKSVSKWERGDGTPDIFILSHIASLYGIPISGIVAQVFCALWSNQLSQIFACSLIIWGAGLSLHLTAHGNRLFLVYVICAVLEVLLILLYTLRAQTRWREWREKRKKMQKASDDSAA